MSKPKNTSNGNLEIEVNGKRYPYRETMGAMLSFKEETGLDAPVDTEDSVKYMYHVVKSNCRRSGEEFKLSFQEFADALDGEEFIRITAALAERANENKDGDAEKTHKAHPNRNCPRSRGREDGPIRKGVLRTDSNRVQCHL